MESQQVAKDDYEFQKDQLTSSTLIWGCKNFVTNNTSMPTCSSMCRNSELVFLWLHWWNYEWEVCTYQFF
jgi:hypothetical protein